MIRLMTIALSFGAGVVAERLASIALDRWGEMLTDERLESASKHAEMLARTVKPYTGGADQ